jgi:hypothetical protein
MVHLAKGRFEVMMHPTYWFSSLEGVTMDLLTSSVKYLKR